MLTFDQETHAYRHRDVACGSVTQIIGEFVKSGNFYVNVFTGTSIPPKFRVGGAMGHIHSHDG